MGFNTDGRRLWLINACKVITRIAKTSVKVNGVGGRDFAVEVGVSRVRAQSTALYIVMEALSKRY